MNKISLCLALSLLGATSQTTAMPSKTMMVGVGCLTGTALLAAKHATAIQNSLVNATKATGKSIKSGTSSLIASIKNWYATDNYADLEIGLGLAATGGFALTPRHIKEKILIGIGCLIAAPFFVVLAEAAEKDSKTRYIKYI